MSYSPDDKVTLVTAWFNEIDEIISDLKSISDKKHYIKIVTPTLYTLLERMAWFRYRRESLNSNERFKKPLLTYSNQTDELEKIDIAFLSQWDKSEHHDNSTYKKT